MFFPTIINIDREILSAKKPRMSKYLLLTFDLIEKCLYLFAVWNSSICILHSLFTSSWIELIFFYIYNLWNQQLKRRGQIQNNLFWGRGIDLLKLFSHRKLKKKKNLRGGRLKKTIMCNCALRNKTEIVLPRQKEIFISKQSFLLIVKLSIFLIVHCSFLALVGSFKDPITLWDKKLLPQILLK